MRQDLIDLEFLIKEKQTELSMLHEEGSVTVAARLELEIDDLQKQFTRLKESEGPGCGDDYPVIEWKSKKYESPVLPDMEEQIDFMKRAQDQTACNPASVEMMEGILQSLVGAKKFQQAAAMRKERDERMIEKMERPFDLSKQMYFIDQLRESIGLQPANELQANLLKMYEAINVNLGWCVWMADITADRLLELPSNKAPSNSPEGGGQAKHIGSLGVFVQQDNVDKSWLAYFEDWCEQPDISGTGDSPEKAITELFKKREQARQEILFPKEVANG